MTNYVCMYVYILNIMYSGFMDHYTFFKHKAINILVDSLYVLNGTYSVAYFNGGVLDMWAAFVINLYCTKENFQMVANNIKNIL